MHRHLSAFIIAVLCVVASRAETITVSAAVSLKDAMTEIAKAFHEKTGDDVQFNFGASGTLATQIRNGAPVDLFISAAEKQVKDLIHDGVCDESSRRVIATNSLVLIAPAEKAEPKDVASLTDDNIKRVAVGDPKIVPAGDYAAQAFKYMKIDEKLRNKLIYGASVRQVLAYVERGEVDAGIVYKTDALAGGAKVKMIAAIDEASHEKIEYPAVIVKASRNPAAAKKFLDYLETEKSQSILKRNGFTLPDKAEAKR